MNLTELREYQLEFEKIRGGLISEYKDIDGLRVKFVNDYPIEKIISLDIDEYVTGKSDSTTFCNRIENELNKWGNIHGSTANKFGLYFGKLGEDSERKYRIGKRYFGTQNDEALRNILTSIAELIKGKDDYSILKRNPISPMFKGKILSVYFPHEFLNIFSASNLDYFINMLSLYNKSKSELDKQKILMDFKNVDLVMKDWSIFEFSKFLYYSFGSPNDEIKEKKLPPELKDFKLKDFSPIESVKYEFVNLDTEKVILSNSTKEKRSRKIDYSKQSKKYKRIGDRGEQIVLKAERNFLEKNGKPELADKVDRISKCDDSFGCDIVSFDLDGKKKFIEVKSTLRPIGFSNIYISSNELEVAELKENYYFYIVYNVGDKKPKIWKIKGVDFLNDENVEKETVLYKIKLKTREKGHNTQYSKKR